MRGQVVILHILHMLQLIQHHILLLILQPILQVHTQLLQIVNQEQLLGQKVTQHQKLILHLKHTQANIILVI